MSENNCDEKRNSGGFRHPRHAQALRAFDRAVLEVPSDQKYVILIYDGGNIAAWDRKASWISDAPEADVKQICRAMVDQLHD